MAVTERPAFPSEQDLQRAAEVVSAVIDFTNVREAQICLALRAHAATLAKAEQYRDEIAEAREACPSIRRQDYFDAPLLKLVTLEVTRGFMRDSQLQASNARAEQYREALERLHARIAAGFPCSIGSINNVLRVDFGVEELDRLRALLVPDGEAK